jgi:hypothetical protein
MMQTARPQGNAAIPAHGNVSVTSGLPITLIATSAARARPWLITSSRTKATKAFSGIGATGKASAPLATTGINSGKSAVAMFEPTFRSNPQSSLWLAVLLRALEDALRPIKTGNNGLSREKQMQDARDYVTTPSRDLLMVCNLAGVDMQVAIHQMNAQVTKEMMPEPNF